MRNCKRALLTASLFLLITLLLGGAVSGAVPDFGEDSETILLRGKVLDVVDLSPEEATQEFVVLEQLATILITSGPYRGQQHRLVNTLTGHPLFDLRLTAGRRVILWGEVDGDNELRSIYLQDFAREGYLYFLGALFVFILLLVGGRKGLTAVLTLVFTLIVLVQVLLPLILRGYSPIPVTILAAAIVTLVTFLAIGGMHRKTFAAVIGTIGGVTTAGMLAFAVGRAAVLTGFSDEEAQMLLYMDTGVLNVQGLLFAGIIIGALGAVMDVAMSISAAAHEVYCANKSISLREQIRAAMNVGRDIMGTMSNTLILAYVGTSMPLLLLFLGYGTPYVTIINSDLVATEVVRALAGSIGLVAAIPLTAVASGLLTARDKKKEAEATL